MKPIVNEQTKIIFKRGGDGHIIIRVPIIVEGGANNDTIDFIYDTGAYITVISNERYEQFNLDKLPRIDVTVGGYTGATPGYLFKIPGLRLGKKVLTGVWAFSPKDSALRQNLLGCNVIEYFCPYQDNENDCIYFNENPSPKPYYSPKYNISLACDGVYLID
ncbi:MAG: retroviral-like aspartic protease family protein [Defluviitaleaceae bacterium]|nr:retroviral-like aspartic protease family protein [Defluviitaleaceae bacterium]